MENLNTIQKRGVLNTVSRLGQKGPGGAYHEYVISIDPFNDPEAILVTFQKGPRHATGSQYGVTDQDLLEIVRDRMKCFLEGEYATTETAHALQHIEEALMWLNKRTEDRIERGVLGTMNK